MLSPDINIPATCDRFGCDGPREISGFVAVNHPADRYEPLYVALCEDHGTTDPTLEDANYFRDTTPVEVVVVVPDKPPYDLCAKANECNHVMHSRCTACKREQYAPAVYVISHGMAPCAWCGQYNAVKVAQ